ncbi:MAG: amino acid adenylation domain-containing protein, partial [Gammaproteobacteria bacterium]|nr:amino acid adenylation domain-containing protein [Gammaproteobacteria bacterium]
NTLALRNDLSGNPTFFDFLERIKQTCLDAYANQEVPFEQVIDELKIKRNYGVNPVFQIMFVLQPEKKQEDLSLSNITSKRICIDPGAAKFDLTFNLLETKEGLTCEVEYRIDLYKKMTICRMADHFVMLLQEIIQNPKNKIKEFSILTRQEQSNILLDWNNTEKTYGLSNPLHQLFEEQARETPDNTAIVFNKKCFSYGQLDKQTNQLAHYLQNYNVKSEQIVAVCLERSNIMIVSLLGVLKSGCAYLPIDPDYPIARIQYILEDSKAGMILTQKKYANKINEVLRGNDFKAKIIVLDDVSCDYHSEPDDSIVIQLSINMLAYVMYTSGSTGKPKGVLIEHKSLINFLYSMQDVFKLDCRDRMLALTPFTFDISGLELYLPLITGACCIISDKKTSSDANRINQMIMDHKISIMQATPATWQMLIDDDWKNSTNIKVLCGGEALSKDLANRLFNLGSPIWNLYGPTETTIWSALYKLKSCPDDVSVTPIGKPIANTQVYILNKYLQPLPIGVPGELYIGGVGLARGYLNRPELTKEKFIKSPFSKEKGSRLYKTGDLVRWMPDGNIEFLGRIDDQVKIRGFRIELDEVNKQLSQIAGVTNSVVLAKDDAGSNKYLAAYLVYQDKSKHDIASIRQQLQQFLPDYMIPEQFFVLDRLPVTPNGKVDRQALLALQQAETESIEPATDSKLEEKIAKVMAELLSTDKVDVSQNFFEMGMHSFLIVQACSRLNAELATNLKPVDLFTYPTIRSISMFLYKPDTDSSPFVAIADRINLKKSKQAKRRKNRYGDTQ